jgi:hypothetical protein
MTTDKATTSVERPVNSNIWGRLWANKLLKEFLLMLASTVAVQLALGLNELLGAFDTARSWGDLLRSAQAWGGAFSFAVVTTVLKQSLAWAIARLAGTRL